MIITRFESVKGISPLIATVLLIAFTVAVGSIFVLWVTGYSKGQTTQVSATSLDQVQCSNSILNIKTLTTNAASGSEIVTMIIGYDSGTLTLYSPIIDLSCGASTDTNTTYVGGGTYSIMPGTVFVVSPNTTKCNSNSLVDYVRVRLTCIGPSSNTNFTVVIDCKKGQGCGL